MMYCNRRESEIDVKQVNTHVRNSCFFVYRRTSLQFLFVLRRSVIFEVNFMNVSVHSFALFTSPASSGRRHNGFQDSLLVVNYCLWETGWR